MCEIIAHHHSPGVISSLNFKILYDADWLVNLPEEVSKKAFRIEIKRVVEKLFFTASARKKAIKMLTRK